MTVGLAMTGWTGTVSGQEGGPRAFWTCELPGGSFMVSLAQITSVSKHEYVVDNAARVTEVVVDTQGSALARFYYLEPIMPEAGATGGMLQDRARTEVERALDKLGLEAPWQKVMKSYPTTTHAGTVEYRLNVKDDVDRVLDSVTQAWTRNRTTQIKLE